MECRDYGRLRDGRPVQAYTLANGLGLKLTALSYGGIVTGLWVPDAQGRSENIVLGFDGIEGYAGPHPFFGIIVGRYGNRIAGARFELDGEWHELSCNDGPNCLHGGAEGFGTRLWQVEADAPRPGEAEALSLSRVSPHGEQGFPGTLQLRVRYALGLDASWRIDYEARTDRATVLNLTHHDYFNLRGSGDVLGHRLMLPASRFTAVDEHLIPIGHQGVAGTPFDFRTATAIGARVHGTHPQLQRGKGYDHHWVLDAPPGEDGLRLAARLEEPESGRVMTLHTREPGLQFYAGCALDGRVRGRGGRPYERWAGLCLETQHAPDSPNRPPDPDWPSTVLRPGEVYRSSTLHRFGVMP